MSVLSTQVSKVTGRGTGRVFVGLAALMSLAMIPASAVTVDTGEYEFTTSSDPYAILALNNNTASGSFGIQANSVAPSAAGIYGYSNASGAPGYGVEGISQNGYGILGSSYGTGVTAILGQDLSTGSGIGIAGQSAGGNGAYGEGQQNGVVGQSNTTSGTYAGVYGTDNSSGSGSAYGVYGTSASNTAVYGYASGAGTALQGASVSGIGLSAYSNDGGLGVIGEPTGEGGIFYGFSGARAHPSLVALNANGTTPPFEAQTCTGSGIFACETTGLTFLVQNGTADASGAVDVSPAADVQFSGDVYVQGFIYSDCVGYPATASGCIDTTEIRSQTSSTGAKLRMYSPKQSTATVEDYGEAQLANGQGYVPLERTFATSIARDRSYLVFITPEGDSRGLYVTGKSLSGFTVRESRGGRSTIGFTYRIVAHPYGDTGVRMAALARKSAVASAAQFNTDPRLLSLLKRQARRASIGARITREPHITVQNLHRQ